MRLTRLRLVGFKTFVEPADVPIEPGLTGIVGPNGCGKSNLVEALRWAMGESSHRSLRAAEMDDVIFAGSGKRPGRNAAEVGLRIDNSDRQAPTQFNGGDEIEVVRRITRGVGSSYRINGREVRARDVQTLFADASTGARSPALIGQGRVGEIIHAKPEGRRRLLEEAAGISGLNARRQEAELRLNAADANLERVEDVLGQLDARIDGLKRQARAASRYRHLSGELRRLEAVRLVLGWREARSQAAEAESAAAKAIAAVAEATRAQGEAARAEGLAEHALPPARTRAQEAGTVHARLVGEAGRLRDAERDARARLTALEQQARTAAQDLARERQLGEDAAEALERLLAEAEELTGTAVADEQRPLLERRLADARAELAAAEAELAAALAADADRNARRAAAARRRDEASAKAKRLRAEVERMALAASGPVTAGGGPSPAELAAELARLAAAAAEAESALQAATEAQIAARSAEAAARGPLAEAESRAVKLAAEASALRKLVQRPRESGHERLIDSIAVDEGFEKAIGAALGDDLEASLDAAAPLHWVLTLPAGDPPLPEDVPCLADSVRAPEALLRRLRQVGIVERAEGARRRTELRQGQRLVSREGDLWRWDGFTRSAEAETQAARRLAERNRLDTLQRRAGEAEAAAMVLRTAFEATSAAVRAAAAREQAAQAATRDARKKVDQLRERLTAAERAEAAENARRAAQVEAESRVRAALAEAETELAAAEREFAALADTPAVPTTAEPQRRAAAARTEAAEAAAALEALRREDEARARRESTLRTEIDAWTKRRKGAEARVEELGRRGADIAREVDSVRDAPERIAAEARALERGLEEAERAAKAAADALALAETAKAEATRIARAALDALSASREAQVRADERFLGAKARLAEATERVAAEHGMTPDALAAKVDIAGVEVEAIEADLARLNRDRDRLGPVNLRAESELSEIESSRASLVAERDDIVAAIRELRRAIHALNEEGRARLLASFETVDKNFRELFSALFQGGEARLELTGGDDPLAAGLEVHAKPPGKRPHTLSLLSGGEQALTALSLVFAVFLTNPAPICVLDEVDAPLDDANVERFCTLLEAMTRTTDTRFLVVTHNPITMSRMNRLLGVTMAEQGVSQLVSVALEEAERLREAG